MTELMQRGGGLVRIRVYRTGNARGAWVYAGRWGARLVWEGPLMSNGGRFANGSKWFAGWRARKAVEWLERYLRMLNDR